MKRKMWKLGYVYAIHLPNGKYAFARIMKDAAISVYSHQGNSVDDLPNDENYIFYVAIYRYVIQSENWTKVGERPYENEEDSWPPKQYNYDIGTGRYKIYYKGEFINSTKEECKGLTRMSVWDEHHLIDKIMGDDKWDRLLDDEVERWEKKRLEKTQTQQIQ